jgi:uncharacterized protein
MSIHMEHVMTQIGNLFRTAAVLAALVAVPAAPLFAQEISPSQLAAALDVINAQPSTASYDTLLPSIANDVTNRLIRARPDLHQEITDTVQAIALKLVVRRKELDQDIARVYAKAFTEEELKTIATFLKSPAGQKYQTDGPKVIADSFQAVQAWSDRMGAELVDKTREELKKQGHDF